MISLSRGVVTNIIRNDQGLQELSVLVGSEQRAALCQTTLVGIAEVGDRVVVNDTARRLKLGSGGYDYVQSIETKLPKCSQQPGHIMRLRYTPFQHAVLSCEEQDSPYHDLLQNADDLAGMPVVCTCLHSQLAAVAGGIASVDPSLRVAYVMTDSACLHIKVSRLVAQLTQSKLLQGTVTCGQAFGGDVEAVNIYSGLLAAKLVMNADIVITGQCVGNTGTGTQFGFSGVDQGVCLNAADSLHGTAVAVLRISEGDARARHRGLSHHSDTILQRICKADCVVPVPSDGGEYAEAALNHLQDAAPQHNYVSVDGQPALDVLDSHSIRVKSMGRDVDHDRVFFLAAGAAGIAAAQLCKRASTSAD